MQIAEEIEYCGKWDVVVCGGGVAGAAAAITCARAGKKTLIIEKTVTFGGLATNGLVNFFVPMCNGRGKQIVFGMADEMLKAAWRCSWTSADESWLKDLPEKKGRLACRFSPALFALTLADMVRKSGAEIYLDTVIDGAKTENGHIDGIIISSKSGRQYVAADYFVDATGDADLLYRAGVPTVTGKNYFTYFSNSCCNCGNLYFILLKQVNEYIFACKYGTYERSSGCIYRNANFINHNLYIFINEKLIFCKR